MFSCPYHGWTYNLSGELIAVPFGNEGFTGIDRDSLGLRPLQVEEKNGLIFVMPNPQLSFDIDDVLGGIDEHLSGFGLDNHYYLGAKRVHTDFSWKLNMDTFHEFYHFEHLHTDSIAQMAYSNLGTYHQYGRNHAMASATLEITRLTEIPEEQWNPRRTPHTCTTCFPTRSFLWWKTTFRPGAYTLSVTIGR